MKAVARFSIEQPRALFSETAAVLTTAPAVVERDFWVTRTLARPIEGGSVIKFIVYAYNTQQIPLTAIWPIRCLR